MQLTKLTLYSTAIMDLLLEIRYLIEEIGEKTGRFLYTRYMKMLISQYGD